MQTRPATKQEAARWELEYQRLRTQRGNDFRVWPRGTIVRGAAQFGHHPALRTAEASPRLVYSFLRMTSSASAAANGRTTIAGVAIPYEKPSSPDPARPIPEVFKRGAFRKSLLLRPNIMVMFNFQTDRILGKTKVGTALVFESERGLEFEAFPPPGAIWADDLLTSIERHDITGAAAGFIPRIQKSEQRNGVRVTAIEEADLVMVSVHGFPEFDGGGLTVTKSESAAASKTSAHDRRFLKQMGIQASAAQLGGRVHF